MAVGHSEIRNPVANLISIQPLFTANSSIYSIDSFEPNQQTWLSCRGLHPRRGRRRFFDEFDRDYLERIDDTAAEEPPTDIDQAEYEAAIEVAETLNENTYEQNINSKIRLGRLLRPDGRFLSP